jgi:hypothetical protein
MKELKELERQAHTSNNQEKAWRTCKALELKKNKDSWPLHRSSI